MVTRGPASMYCISCGERSSFDEVPYSCRRCGDLLELRFDIEALEERVREEDWRSRPLSVWRYRPFIPVDSGVEPVTLGEGGTGLYRCKRLSGLLGLKEIYVKNEGENPTGSFKDRGITVGITKALELGARTVICASTGNTASSLAAYAAKAGIRCIVLVPSEKVAIGKMAQAIIYGAEVVQIEGSFDRALQEALGFVERHGEVYMLNSVNPFRIEGQKTLAFEMCDGLGGPPDKAVVPVGNGSNLTAIWKGFTEYRALGLIDRCPKMVGIQAEGASPIATAVKEGLKEIVQCSNPETVATAIRIGSPVSWKKVLRAIYDSGGTAEAVNDEEILEAQRLLARSEALFVEPASAATIAGLKRLLEYGGIEKGERIVCVATGHGLKDPDAVLKGAKMLRVEPEPALIDEALRM